MHSRRILFVAVALTPVLNACNEVFTDVNRVVALQISSELPTVEEGDTTTLEVEALNGRGELVPDARVFWAVLDTGTIGIELDSATGMVSGLFPSEVRVVARFESLRSNPIVVRVTAAPDSIGATGDTRLTVPEGNDRSPDMVVSVLDNTTDTTQSLPLAGKAVLFSITSPPTDDPLVQNVFLSQAAGDEREGDGRSLTITSAGNGLAIAAIQRVPDTAAPDSVVVEASAHRSDGESVLGSPIQFTVVFSQQP